MITDIESATFGSQSAYKYHINIVNYPLIGLKYVKINGINLFKKKIPVTLQQLINQVVKGVTRSYSSCYTTFALIIYPLHYIFYKFIRC